MRKSKLFIAMLSFVLLLSACSLLSKPSLDSAKKLAKDGKVDEAVDMIEDLIDADETNYELYLSLADVYLDDEDYRKVDRTLEDLSEVIEDNFDADDEVMLDALDDMIDFAKDLKRDEEPVGDWFAEFFETKEVKDLEMNISKVIDQDSSSTITDKNDTTNNDEKDTTNNDSNDTGNSNNNDKQSDAGFELMSYTYQEVIDAYGTPDTEDIGLNTTELIYDDLEYTFMFENTNLNGASTVGIVSLTGPDGRIHSNEPLIGQNINVLRATYGYGDISYYEQTIMNSGLPFAKTTDGTFYYMLFLDGNDNVTDCFIQRVDYSSAMDYYAEDYLGYTLGEIKEIYGNLYFVDANETSYIVMYFGMPYYFMFDSAAALDDYSVVTTVSLESGGRTMYSDPLMTMTEDEFAANYLNNYDSVDYDEEFGMAIVEAFGAYAIVVFDPSEYPNQVMVTWDLNQFGLGGAEDYIPVSGFDYLGYTYGDLVYFIGEPVYNDDTGPYRYLEYDNVPYDFGFSLNEDLSDNSIIYTVFIYFDEGGIYYDGLSYADMTYDKFMNEEAQYYNNILWIEEDLRLEFEDDYSYYYLFYPEGEYPTYMLIETK